MDEVREATIRPGGDEPAPAAMPAIVTYARRVLELCHV